MNVRAYYNEIDPDAVAVLRELIADDVIAPGDVDDRSIKDVQPGDLVRYTQCHFFAGGGLWSVAARLAGWPDDRPLWTGSCPCQPFSQAGKGRGTDDPRHLWPDFHRLIRACRPAVVMGEQVAGKAGRHWFHGVRADLEGSAYASRAVDVPACAVDAPHERNRLWWIAVADSGRLDWRGGPSVQEDRQIAANLLGTLVHGSGVGRGEGRAEHELQRGRATTASADAPNLDVALPERRGCEGWDAEGRGAGSAYAPTGKHGRNGSWWADAEWIVCHDGKARRTKPGLSLLVDGLPGRVGLWRIAGNAISPVLAAEVLAAFLDAERGVTA